MIKASLFAVAVILAPLRASADCTPDQYGKCGEVPPATDRYEKPAAEKPAAKKPAPKKGAAK